MSTDIGTFLTCGCNIAAGQGISWCPLYLAATKLSAALANLEKIVVLLSEMQRAGMTVSPEVFEALANHCRIARDAIAQVRPC